MNQPEAAILLSSGNQDHTTTILATASGSYKNRVYINSPLTLDLIRLLGKGREGKGREGKGRDI